MGTKSTVTDHFHRFQEHGRTSLEACIDRFTGFRAAEHIMEELVFLHPEWRAQKDADLEQLSPLEEQMTEAFGRCFRGQDERGAQHDLIRIGRAHPNDPAGRAAFRAGLRILARDGKLWQAEQMIETELRPPDASSLRLRGLFLILLGNRTAAFDVLERALDLAPDDKATEDLFAALCLAEGAFRRFVRTCAHIRGFHGERDVDPEGYAGLAEDLDVYLEALPGDWMLASWRIIVDGALGRRSRPEDLVAVRLQRARKERAARPEVRARTLRMSRRAVPPKRSRG